MNAMQYSFTFPSDYNMEIIERRVAEKGHLFDDVPGLGFKAFLSARKGDADTGAVENTYAPFYVWTDESATRDFLCGDGFAGLVNSFGRPSIDSWLNLSMIEEGDIRNARFASRSIDTINQYASLKDLLAAEKEHAQKVIGSGALLTLSALDTKNWRKLQFALWDKPVSNLMNDHTRVYNVLHTSAPMARIR